MYRIVFAIALIFAVQAHAQPECPIGGIRLTEHSQTTDFVMPHGGGLTFMDHWTLADFDAWESKYDNCMSVPQNRQNVEFLTKTPVDVVINGIHRRIASERRGAEARLQAEADRNQAEAQRSAALESQRIDQAERDKAKQREQEIRNAELQADLERQRREQAERAKEQDIIKEETEAKTERDNKLRFRQDEEARLVAAPPVLAVSKMCGFQVSMHRDELRNQRDLFDHVNSCVDDQQSVYDWLKNHWQGFRPEVKIYCATDGLGLFTDNSNVGYTALKKCIAGGVTQQSAPSFRVFKP